MIVLTDSVEMAIQEWFYLHPWGYWMYWIVGIPSVYYSLIYSLQRIDRLIVRLPHALSGTVETEQGLNSKSKEISQMIKDEFYREACESAREMAHHGHHSTQEQVESHAEKLRIQAMSANLKKLKLNPTERPPASYRYE